MEIMATDLKGLKKTLLEKLKGNKALLIGLAAGILLLALLPKSTKSAPAAKTEFDAPEFSLADEEEKIAQALSRIDGAGKVTILLTLKSGVRREVAEDEKFEHSSRGDDASTSSARTSVKLQSGSGNQSALTLRYDYPEYLGALVITESADASVKLAVTQAVMSLTGLSADKITVVKGK
ncbi:MAG: stage III sporulation protein AG [Oscillospiraceae bacterium]|jgi:stage III sporulation protein AG|nr:stage III sporulation protein AG [Oscillospiraceae bacterium]